MKFSDSVNTVEPVAALIQGSSVNDWLLFRHGYSGALSLFTDGSGSYRDWFETVEANTVLKLYYPGDIIKIEV